MGGTILVWPKRREFTTGVEAKHNQRHTGPLPQGNPVSSFWGARRRQDAAKTPQDAPIRPQDVSKSAQTAPKTPQVAAKTIPRRIPEASWRHPEAPWSQEPPKSRQDDCRPRVAQLVCALGCARKSTPCMFFPSYVVPACGMTRKVRATRNTSCARIAQGIHVCFMYRIRSPPIRLSILSEQPVHVRQL